MSPVQAFLRSAGDKAHTVEVVIHTEAEVLHVIPWAGEKKKKELDTLFRETMADRPGD